MISLPSARNAGTWDDSGDHHVPDFGLISIANPGPPLNAIECVSIPSRSTRVGPCVASRWLAAESCSGEGVRHEKDAERDCIPKRSCPAYRFIRTVRGQAYTFNLAAAASIAARTVRADPTKRMETLSAHVVYLATLITFGMHSSSVRPASAFIQLLSHLNTLPYFPSATKRNPAFFATLRAIEIRVINGIDAASSKASVFMCMARKQKARIPSCSELVFLVVVLIPGSVWPLVATSDRSNETVARCIS